MRKKEFAVAVDYGGTKMLIGIVDDQGSVLNIKRYATGFRDQQSAMQRILFGLDDFLKSTNTNNCIKSIGVGVVGNVDPKSGYWNTMYDEGDHGFPLAKIVNEKFNVPCAVDNDVKAATIAEIKFGKGKMTKEFIYLNIGTGIAAGFVANGKLLRGIKNDAGEIGHIFVEGFNDVHCWCRKFGCFESISSGYGIELRYASLKKENMNNSLIQKVGKASVSEIFNMAKKGDLPSKRITLDAVDAISKMVSNLIEIFDPEVVVLNGGVVTNDWFFQMIKKTLTKKSKQSASKEIVLSNLNPSTVGLVGASVLGLEKY